MPRRREKKDASRSDDQAMGRLASQMKPGNFHKNHDKEGELVG